MIHTGEMPYKCNLCDFRSNYAQSLKKHLLEHNDGIKNNALLHSGCTPPRTYSSLTSHFSAPNHRKDMKLFVHDPNTSKNAWHFFKSFFTIKNWQTK